MIMYFGNFHTPLVCEGKLQNQTEKEFLGPNEVAPDFLSGCRYIEKLRFSMSVYIGKITVNCQRVSAV